MEEMSGDEALTGSGEGSLPEQAEQSGSSERAALTLRERVQPWLQPSPTGQPGPRSPRAGEDPGQYGQQFLGQIATVAQRTKQQQ